MDTNVMQQVLDELFPALEALEAQSGAIMEFLKERGIASENDLAPFVERAANASNVRWRAARLRIDHLLSGAAKAEEASEKKAREENEEQKNDKTDAKQGEEARRAEEGPRDSRENPEPAEKTTSEANVEAAPDPGPSASGEGAKKEGKNKKEESRGTGEGKPGKPGSKNAA